MLDLRGLSQWPKCWHKGNVWQKWRRLGYFASVDNWVNKN